MKWEAIAEGDVLLTSGEAYLVVKTFPASFASVDVDAVDLSTGRLGRWRCPLGPILFLSGAVLRAGRPVWEAG